MAGGPHHEAGHFSAAGEILFPTVLARSTVFVSPAGYSSMSTIAREHRIYLTLQGVRMAARVLTIDQSVARPDAKVSNNCDTSGGTNISSTRCK